MVVSHYYRIIRIILANQNESYLYWLSTSQDANFRYKGRQRDTKMEDVSLSSGWSYFVEHTQYLEHIKKYANQEEVQFMVMAHGFDYYICLPRAL